MIESVVAVDEGEINALPGLLESGQRAVRVILVELDEVGISGTLQVAQPDVVPVLPLLRVDHDVLINSHLLERLTDVE